MLWAQLRIAAVILKVHQHFIRATKLSVRLSTSRNPSALHLHTHISLQDGGQRNEAFSCFRTTV